MSFGLRFAMRQLIRPTTALGEKMTTLDQQALADGVSRLLRAEPFVEAAWLAWSLGRGAGDRYSDVDVLALAIDGKFVEASRSVASKLATVAPIVLSNSLFGGRVLNSVTRSWARFDISFIEAAELGRYNARHLKPLFNKGERTPPERADLKYRTAPDGLLMLVQEFYRVLGLVVVGVGREEYVLLVSGVEHLRRMTIDLMLEENSVAPENRGGALHRRPLLTSAQYQALLSLPPLSATRESTIEAHRAFSEIFIPRAKALAAQIGMPWPAELAAATYECLHKNIGLTIE